ncbi:MAG TPA: hypothetical protein EYP55_07165 [Anaerolineae bacterium]|nr:hypothetical protein [Anaerolineae bacterium]
MSEMTVEEILDDIRAADEQLRTFERKYGLNSEVFYELFCQGKLDDGEYEQTEDFCMWAGFYELKRDREKKFVELSRQYIAQLEAFAKANNDYFQLLPREELIKA